MPFTNDPRITIRDVPAISLLQVALDHAVSGQHLEVTVRCEDLRDLLRIVTTLKAQAAHVVTP